jgi:hypothetical protein
LYKKYGAAALMQRRCALVRRFDVMLGIDGGGSLFVGGVRRSAWHGRLGQLLCRARHQSPVFLCNVTNEQ